MTQAGDRAERRVLLIVGGGIAAYKALELARGLRKAGVAVRPVMTAAAAQFVTPLSLAALCEDKVYGELFSLTDEAEMGHIELSRSADLIVVAPATADLMAKAAHGLCDDLASTVLLATDTPVLMAPAMNVRMWTHPATRRNLATLRADGIAVVGPDVGAMACGEFGEGRLAEPEVILQAALAMLSRGGAKGGLAGRRALVSAGPTREAIDPVRYISNHSSGKQGYAVAQALADLGAEVTLVTGPSALATPVGVRRVEVESSAEMQAACGSALPADVAVLAAAVADWRPAEVSPRKIKKSGSAPAPLELVETADILAALSAPGPMRPRLVIGFAAETDELEAHARDKLARKGCDWIVANDVSSGVFGSDNNAVKLVTSIGVEDWGAGSKLALARRLAQRIAEALGG